MDKVCDFCKECRGPLYKCNPSKNVKCSKSSCYQNGGPCHMTKNPEFSDDKIPICIYEEG